MIDYHREYGVVPPQNSSLSVVVSGNFWGCLYVGNVLGNSCEGVSQGASLLYDSVSDSETTQYMYLHVV